MVFTDFRFTTPQPSVGRGAGPLKFLFSTCYAPDYWTGGVAVDKSGTAGNFAGGRRLREGGRPRMTSAALRGKSGPLGRGPVTLIARVATPSLLRQFVHQGDLAAGPFEAVAVVECQGRRVARVDGEG